MGGFRLGPVVLSAPRFYAAMALVVLVVAAEVAARARKRPELSGWAWSAALVVVAGARLGFVVLNAAAFARAPWRVIAIWQGGFAPWWGLAVGVVYTAVLFRRRRAALALAAVPALLAFAAWWVVPLAVAPAAPQVAGLPDQPIARLDGAPLSLATLRGEPVVVNLWATWCPPCRRELPMLAAAATSHPDVHFVFASQGEAAETVRGYLSERSLALGVVLVDEGQILSRAFDALGFPTTLFFDASGALVHTHVGELSDIALGDELATLSR